ncbi:MAG: Rid family detoxifying hydrolase [candidate division FCPU426 bacterium]
MDYIESPHAPKPVGPYAQAVRTGDWLFCSGQVPLDPETNKRVEGGIEAQTRRVLHNLQAVISAAGATLGQVAKATVYLTDLADFPEFNRVYQEFMGSHRPARATVQVAGLPIGAKVEIEAVVYLGKD